jgi:cation transport ATPase
VTSSLDGQKKKRAENIQVLVALAILGAYSTGFYQNLNDGSRWSFNRGLMFVMG